MARKIFTVIAVLMFILTLSSCQKGVSQQEYDGLKAQLDTANSELNSYKESAEQAENDLSDLKSKVASVKQYADIISALFNMFGPNNTGQGWEEITTMVTDTGNQEVIDEWSNFTQANDFQNELRSQIDQKIRDINDTTLIGAWQKLNSGGGSSDEVLSAIEAVGDNDLIELFNNFMNAPQSDMFKVLEVLIKGISDNTANL
ncbi:MAG: hypothetical protein KJ821_04815 [Actinobacteria bacterium]|nr:hypothetical protein [Actinomycetota bacterium]MBU4482654.1 hypothetical protein [Actinomycetota bacterium]MCG2790948.1 hypothetical protein [Actinomycetes bacterium]